MPAKDTKCCKHNCEEVVLGLKEDKPNVKMGKWAAELQHNKIKALQSSIPQKHRRAPNQALGGQGGDDSAELQKTNWD